MHRRREDVVRGLAHVDVVVRVDVLARERGDHLVRVHVRATCPSRSGRRRSGTGRRARRPRSARRGGDPLRLVGVEQPEVGVRARGGGLDPAEPARDGRGDRLAGDREVGDRLRRLASPELLPLLDLRHHGESREAGAGDGGRSYATDGSRCSPCASSRGARRSVSFTSSTGAQPRYPHSGHSGASKCLKRSRRARRFVPHWRHSTTRLSTSGPSAPHGPAVPLFGEGRSRPARRDRPPRAEPTALSQPEFGLPRPVTSSQPELTARLRVLVERLAPSRGGLPIRRGRW